MGVIYLIRHARPTISGVILGSSDPPAAVNVPPSDLQVDRIFCSPLQRALHTATHLFPLREICCVAQLAERHMGDWEMKSWPDIQAQWPTLATCAESNWFAVTPPGGEPWPLFQNRVHDFQNRINRTETTAVVAHAGVNSVLWELFTGRSALTFQQDYEETIAIEL